MDKDDIGCPDGVFTQFNIDATVNSAYVVMGMLYGKGDFNKTIEISTVLAKMLTAIHLLPQASLCTIVGYNAIPKILENLGLKEAEDTTSNIPILHLTGVRIELQPSFRKHKKKRKVEGNKIQL